MSRRPGLTLLDYVVTLVLLITLLGLILTYTVRGREHAMRVQCSDNLRRIGDAMRSFHDASGGAQPNPAFLPASRIAEGYATWAVQIAPHLVNQSPLLEWDLRRSYVAQPAQVREAALTAYLCPARARVRTSFISSGGDVDAAAAHLPGAVGDYGGVAGNGAPQHDWTGPTANGPIILGRVLEEADGLILRWRGRVALDDLERGQSYTLLAGEKHVPAAGLGQARFGDGSLYNGTLPACSTRVGGPGHPLALDPAGPGHANFGSYHPGVCLFVQADTAVRPISVDVEPALLGALTTR